jgi:soluble lytic murein transglycosylase-like protein
MRMLAVCATLIASSTGNLCALELQPAKLTFAYAARHSHAPVSPSVISAMFPEDVSVISAMFPEDNEERLDAEVAELPKAPRTFSRAELCRAAASVAEANNLPIPFFANLIQQESGWKPHVVSPAGAQGIAQFMPRVARAYGLANPFDPIHALAVSGKFLSELLEQFGNIGLAAAAYNAGPKRVQDWIAKRRGLPAETRDYVRNITGHPADRWRNAKAQGHRLPAYARCPDAATREAQALERGKPDVNVADVAARKASGASVKKASRTSATSGKQAANLPKSALEAKAAAKPALAAKAESKPALKIMAAEKPGGRAQPVTRRGAASKTVAKSKSDARATPVKPVRANAKPVAATRKAPARSKASGRRTAVKKARAKSKRKRVKFVGSARGS